MNNYRKGLCIAALSALLAGAVAPSFAAGSEAVAQPEASQVERAGNGGAGQASASRASQSNEGRGTSSYSLHSALLRAPAAPAAMAQR